MDPPVDQWDLVIKVKHGDTLRRITAYVHGQLMDHSMIELRSRIINLFKFSDDADFILTYADEDGDLVTLDNDDELRDAVIGQRLNPLRINVQLKPKADSSDPNSDKSSPLKNAQPVNQQPATDGSSKCIPDPVTDVVADLFSTLQRAVSSSSGLSQLDEACKSDPFKSVITNLSKDFTRAASSSPACGQLVEYFPKLGLVNTSQPSGPTNGPSGSSICLVDLNAADERKVATDSPNNDTVFVGVNSKQNGFRNPSVEGNVAAENSDHVEQTLLKELEEMGFMQIDLNKEILRQNQYGLEQSVDELCGLAKWGPLLAELHDMGFYDKELNKNLLIVNGGSIERAVLELIGGE